MWAGRGGGLSLARGNICSDAVTTLRERAFCGNGSMRDNATTAKLVGSQRPRAMKTCAATG